MSKKVLFAREVQGNTPSFRALSVNSRILSQKTPFQLQDSKGGIKAKHDGLYRISDTQFITNENMDPNMKRTSRRANSNDSVMSNRSHKS